MADDLVLMESFDDGFSLERSVANQTYVGSSYGKDDNGARLGTTSSTTVTIPTTLSHLYGFSLRVNSGASGTQDIITYGVQTKLQYNATNSSIGLWWYTGSVFSANAAVPIDTWVYVEVLMYTNNKSGGYVKIWIDGANVVDQSGIDFFANQVGSTELIGGTLPSFDIDNLYVLNNCSYTTTPYGPGVVVFGLPDDNGNSSDLVGSDSNSTDNYLLVDEAVPSSTDYVGSGTDGDTDTYSFDDVSISAVTIKAVSKVFYAQKTDSGSKFLVPVVRSDGTDYVGASIAPAESSWGWFEQFQVLDPDTSAEWTPTGYNAAEFGLKVSDT